MLSITELGKLESAYFDLASLIHKEDEETSDDIPLWDKFNISMSRQLNREWQSVAKRALKSGMSKFTGDRSTLEAAQITSAIQERLEKFTDDSALHIQKQIEDMYKAVSLSFLKRYDLVVQKSTARETKTGRIVSDLSLRDQLAIDMIRKVTLQSAGKYFPEKVMTKVAEVVRDYSLETGIPASEVADKLESELGGALGLENVSSVVPTRFATNSRAYFELLTNNSAGLAINVSRIVSMSDVGIKKYRVVAIIDARTSAICRQMDGRVISVSAGLEMADRIINTESPTQLAETFPWDRWLNSDVGPNTEQNNDALARNGLGFPPWHGHCRSFVIPEM